MLNVLSTYSGEPMSMKPGIERLGGAEREVTPTVGADAEGDGEIRQALAEGRFREALALCLGKHSLAVGRVCMAMVGSQSEAEELAQETFLAAFQALGTYRAEGSVRAWLLGIARKKCLRQLEERRRHQAKLVLIKGGERSPDAEELVQLREAAERARAALLQVRPTEREALVLRYQGELSFESVAEACAVDASAARKRVSRGLSRLRALLGVVDSKVAEAL
jgi:RNA polymerase sigma-70 factor, ECF subfamily